MHMSGCPRPLALVAVMGLLTACGTGASETPAVVSPPLVDYDPAFRAAAADAVEALPADSPIIVLLEDCGELRAKVRALRGDL